MDHRYALFGFDSYEPIGGWRDIYGRYTTRRDAEEVARHAFRSFDHWQLVDLGTGEALWEKSSYELNPCRSTGTLKHIWGPWRAVVKQKDISEIFGCFLTVSAMPMQVQAPTRERSCKRCGEHEDDGKYVVPGIFPTLTPLENLMPRVAGTK